MKKTDGMKHTSKRLLNVDHLPRAGLHKTTTMLARIRQSVTRSHRTALLEITFVAYNQNHRRRPAGEDTMGLARPLVVLKALGGLRVNQFQEMIEGAQAGRVGEVVN